MGKCKTNAKSKLIASKAKEVNLKKGSENAARNKKKTPFLPPMTPTQPTQPATSRTPHTVNSTIPDVDPGYKSGSESESKSEPESDSDSDPSDSDSSDSHIDLHKSITDAKLDSLNVVKKTKLPPVVFECDDTEDSLYFQSGEK